MEQQVGPTVYSEFEKSNELSENLLGSKLLPTF